MASRRVHYDACIKRKAILYAKENGNRAAARKFDTDEANIRRWRKQSEKIFACKSATKSFTGPKKGRYPEVDDTVAQFVREVRSKALPVTIQMLQCKAKEAVDKFRIENFKASRGWCEKFMKREGFFLEGELQSAENFLQISKINSCNSHTTSSSYVHDMLMNS
ncbi:pogo transposable element with KRAB domain [Trichonephila clavipes]|nr:pogo transposable element with KRAB domain [Trichonephila clavipes]